jgi:hypothetical protein
MVSQGELENATWRKSSRSDNTATGQCVSMAPVGSYCAIRNSKEPNGAVIVFSKAELRTFFREIKQGNFD